MDPLEERIGARQRSARGLAQARLAKLPRAVALLRGLGAERVWLFGSLSTGATHDGSDVDLMVRGLPPGERTNAWLKLEELFEAPVDLVPEEAASSPFRRAVHDRGQDVTALEVTVSPSEVATTVRWRLAADIETELASQGRVAERICASCSVFGISLAMPMTWSPSQHAWRSMQPAWRVFRRCSPHRWLSSPPGCALRAEGSGARAAAREGAG